MRWVVFTLHNAECENVKVSITPVEITGLATGWGVAGARGGWLGTG